jgi:hypothetical protein
MLLLLTSIARVQDQSRAHVTVGALNPVCQPRKTAQALVGAGCDYGHQRHGGISR